MPRIAFTAKPATSRTRHRTSIGSHPKAAEVRITRTCSWLCGLTLAAIVATNSQAAEARLTTASDGALAYVQARAASLGGDHARSAALLAELSALRPDDADLARKALTESIGAGKIDLALKLAHTVPAARLTNEARLLLVSEEVKRKRYEQAHAWLAFKGDTGDLTFLSPLITAWALAERGDADRALRTIEEIPQNSLLGPLKPEQTALILLKARRTADAEPFARRAIGAAGARETRIRLALADGFLAAGDRQRALIMLDGMGLEGPAARRRLESGRASGQAIDTPAKALGEALTAFSADLARMQRGAPPIGLVQVARFADPQNSSTALLLALLLNGEDRSAEALELLKGISPRDALISHVRDIQSRTLADQQRMNEAYALAAAAVRSDAGVSDHSRLGEVFEAMDRHNEAADAYGRAVALATSQGLKNELWTLHLLRASSLEAAGRWPEARQALQQGLAIAPDQPLLLNFLGYGQLERGEELDAAEALIRKASELAPEDASITDSLGWAQYKRGKLAEAIVTLQRAAEKDPDQAEIHEHLGDALYMSGRKFEARFAWSAALVTAQDDMAKRVQAKLDAGLTPANAAP